MARILREDAARVAALLSFVGVRASDVLSTRGVRRPTALDVTLGQVAFAVGFSTPTAVALLILKVWG